MPNGRMTSVKRRAAVPGFLTHKTGVLQMLPDQVPDTRFIVNDQYFCHKDDLLIYLYL